MGTGLLLVCNSRNMGTRNITITNAVNTGLAGPGEADLTVDTFNTVGRVDVLDEGDLEASSTTLAGGDSRVG